MQIGGKDIENLLINMMLKKNFRKDKNMKKTPFHAFSLGNGLNKF
jgi:hypothetical protein